ncbi:Ethanolamine utilization protein similar to PduU [Furfurilactobacillus rossiae]|uniref:BMC domain-containing protein n=1 Tax=Furfurilactobacillus rossiae TaxID=231049 RepID=UPI0015BFC809|nr:BMC domain-containing protein [Furfurilactobacillus rossiae]MCF6166624.1 BMC domain-containing protein [Furfurilactobacillus rossiae]QLE64372.1 Ethanolamine utilization protein similar to PduU [Furfurilactobacillus rossiae]
MSENTFDHAENLERVIQESVPGKQVTLAHIILHPDKEIFDKLGIEDTSTALGLLTITPGEAAAIASDVSGKAGNVNVVFIDRFSGSVLLAGQVDDVRAAIEAAEDTLSKILDFTITPITQS